MSGEDVTQLRQHRVPGPALPLQGKRGEAFWCYIWPFRLRHVAKIILIRFDLIWIRFVNTRCVYFVLEATKNWHEANLLIFSWLEIYASDLENGLQNIHVNVMTRLVHFDGCLLLIQADGFSALVQSSVLGKGVKHRPPPIKLPAGSACASSGETNL